MGVIKFKILLRHTIIVICDKWLETYGFLIAGHCSWNSFVLLSENMSYSRDMVRDMGLVFVFCMLTK